MKYSIWKINILTAQVVHMMPVWFTTLHEARAAMAALNDQYPSSRTGFQYVLKEVFTEISKTDDEGEEHDTCAGRLPSTSSL